MVLFGMFLMILALSGATIFAAYAASEISYAKPLEGFWEMMTIISLIVSPYLWGKVVFFMMGVPS